MSLEIDTLNVCALLRAREVCGIDLALIERTCCSLERFKPLVNVYSFSTDSFCLTYQQTLELVMALA